MTSEFIKHCTALAAGALVFSAGLVGEKVTLVPQAHWLLTASWGLLAVSVLGGILAYGRVPIQLADEKYNLKSRFLTYPARVQQATLVFGMLFLAGALFLALTAPSVTGTLYAVPSAIEAVEEARKHVPAGVSSLRLAKLQSILGVDEKNPSARVWQVGFEGEQRRASPRCRKLERFTLDVFLDARTGTAYTVP